MKLKNILVIAILAILVVSLAGCTTQQGTPTVNPSATPSANPSTTPGTASPTPQPNISGSSLFNAASVHMFEYKATTTEGGQTMVMNVKYQTSNEQYNGVPCRHVVMTMTTAPGAEVPMDMKYDYYVDIAGKTVLGAHITAKMGDIEMDMPVDTSKIASSDMMLSAEKNSGTYTFAGIEPVTVPAGTFPLAAKYTSTIGGEQYTYWKDPLTPVPVKIASPGSTMELVAWS